MASKVRAAAVALILVGLILSCHLAGEGMRRQISREKEIKETSELTDGAAVIIDAGHGGADSGKIGVNGRKEKDINLEISIKIRKLLSDNGITVRMTRDSDERLADSQTEDLKERTDIINEGALLAVSIHQNSYHDPSISGAQVFYYTGSAEGEKAAAAIQEKLNRAVPGNTKKIRANDSYYILKNTEIPVVIVECGFLSNYAEADKLVDEAWQAGIAEAVSAGIMEYIND